MTTTPDTVRLHQEAAEAYNRHDVDALLALRAEGSTLHDHALGQVFTGAAEIRAYVEANFAGFPDDRLEQVEVAGAGEWTIARMVMSGTHTGPWGGLEPTHRVGTMDLCALVRWEGGRAVEEHVYYDLYGMLAQLGQVPPLTATA